MLADVERLKQGLLRAGGARRRGRLLNCAPGQRAGVSYVHLYADCEAGFLRAARLGPGERETAQAAEARLLYVALTRARLGLHLSRADAKWFGARSTTADILN